MFLPAQIQGRWFHLILDQYIRRQAQALAELRDGKGVERLVSEIRLFAPALVVLQDTGGFEVTLAAALASLWSARHHQFTQIHDFPE